jgi:hypothetical protein
LLKIEVHTFTAEDFVELAPTPPSTVTPPGATTQGSDPDAAKLVIDWVGDRSHQYHMRGKRFYLNCRF